MPGAGPVQRGSDISVYFRGKPGVCNSGRREGRSSQSLPGVTPGGHKVGDGSEL